MAGAIAAFYAQIPVGHVEAGLRTHNIYSPWPEEMNRQITGRIATYNFSPTQLSEKNLIEEKVHGNIYVTGNTVIDALHMVVDKLKSDKALAKEQDAVLAKAGYDVSRLENGKKLVLITGHRRENFGDGFIRMVTAMNVMKTDVKETDNSYEVDIDLPGFKKDEIEAKLENGYLTISAAKGLDKEEKDEKDGKYIRKERYSGAMSRSFYVGDELKQEDIKAKYEDGILKLSVPKKEQKKVETTKHIAIEG